MALFGLPASEVPYSISNRFFLQETALVTSVTEVVLLSKLKLL